MSVDEFNDYPKHGGLTTIALGLVKTKHEWLQAYVLNTSGYDSVEEMIESLTPTLLGWGGE